MVEFAILLPLATTLLVGIWEVGRLIEVCQILHHAAREGGRQAATGLRSSSQVEEVVRNTLHSAGLPTEHAVITVTNLAAPELDVSLARCGDPLQVTVHLPVSDVRWLALSFFTDARTQLTAEVRWVSTKNPVVPVQVTSPSGY